MLVEETTPNIVTIRMFCLIYNCFQSYVLDFPKESGVEVCNGREIPLFPNETTASAPEELIDFPIPTSRPVEKTTHVPAPVFDFPDHTSKVITTKGPATRPTTQMPLIDFPISSQPTTTSPPLVDFPISSTTSEPTTTTEKNYPNLCITGITREDVKAYWSSDEARDCPKTITNAVFLNQLQRFSVLKMNKIFDTRIQSLQQISELLNLIFTLMTKTCPEEAVSKEFLTAVTDAFTMFVKEDFFYGVEDLEPLVFHRFTNALQLCINRATVFNISMEPRECSNVEVSKVSGSKPTQTFFLNFFKTLLENQRL